MAYLTIDPATGAVEQSFRHISDEGLDAAASTRARVRRPP
jgi:hypothetical protein